MAKKEKDFFNNTLVDTALLFTSPTFYFVKKEVEKALENYQDNEDLAKQVNDWDKFTTGLAQHPVSDRTSIMFLSNEATDLIWRNREVVESPIKYIPQSKGIPKGISLVGNLNPGILYVVDPRDESRYYNAKEINLVLLKDHLLEMKSVFERLGALQIDISFDNSEEEIEDTDNNFNASTKGSYNGHSVSGKYSSGNKRGSYRSKLNQLEIHKKCTSKRTDIDLNKCYWTSKDETFKSEINSVIEGLTEEVHFRKYAQSYVRQTSMNIQKIEAEYSYLSQIGVEGMCEWDDVAMSELTQSTVWDVHVAFEKRTNPTDVEYLTESSSSLKAEQNLLAEEKEYVEMVRDVLSDGEISDRERRLLEKLRVKLGISTDRVAQLEATASQPQLTDNEQEYYDTIKEMLEGDGEITPRERRLLDRIREQSCISVERAKEIEAIIIT